MEHHPLTFRRFLEDAVADSPNAPLLIWNDEHISYHAFNERVDRVANVWHGLGVRRGDRVAFMADNKPDFLYAWLGLAKLGATLVAINTGFKATETRYLLEHSQSKYAIIDDTYTDVFQTAVEGVDHLAMIYAFQPGAAYPHFGELVETADPVVPDVDVSPEDIMSFIYTSGTTGRPKAVMQPQRNFVLTGQAYPYWMHMDRGDRIYACLPLFHINSQAYSMMGAIGARGAIVLAPRFSASRFWDDIKRHRVAVFNFIGAMTLILSKKEHDPRDREHAVKVAYGVPALPGDLREELESRYGMKIVSGFGMSETTFGLLEPFDDTRRPGAMGFPRHHPNPTVQRTEARIVAPDGTEMPDGESGELILRGPATMVGYFNDEERTIEALRDGWLWTGDLAYKDESGQFFFVDRIKDIIRRRGENVSSLEVEDVINDHPDVLESAVVGIPSDLLDEELAVFIVSRSGADPDFAAIGDFASERLAKFKIPRYYQRLDELPKTPTQKVEKHRLRANIDLSKGYDRELAQPR